MRSSLGQQVVLVIAGLALRADRLAVVHASVAHAVGAKPLAAAVAAGGGGIVAAATGHEMELPDRARWARSAASVWRLGAAAFRESGTGERAERTKNIVANARANCQKAISSGKKRCTNFVTE